MSGEEMAVYLSKKVEAQAKREKAGYMDRAVAARKAAEPLSKGENFRAVSVIDKTTYYRHELANPGCMSDPSYRASFAKSNPETVLGT